MATADADTIALLLERIAVAVERLAERRSGDADAARLMRAAFAALGNEPFTMARLKQLSESPLRIALQHAVAGRSTHSLGKVLGAHVGETIDGLRLERVGRTKPAVYRLIDVESRDSRKRNPWR